MNFWVKVNGVVKKIFPNYIWDIPNKENRVFLTFDDGPTPEVTEWVLNQLKIYNVKATFFCVGENVKNHSEIFKKIISEGHAIGNHSLTHLNGWKTPIGNYIRNIEDCSAILRQYSDGAIENPFTEEPKTQNLKPKTSFLFRPPYGKLKPSQSKALRKIGYKIIMWDVLTRDYHPDVTPEECYQNLEKNVSSGSIIIFHDSVKAYKNLEYTLPKTLEFLKTKGYVCSKID